MSDTIILRRTGQAPLRLRGELLAKAKSSPDSGMPNYSGRAGRFTEAAIYKTASGRYVAHVLHGTRWQGEHDSHEAAVYPSLKECVDFLSDRVPGWILTGIIADLGEETVAEEVE
jgi:hypothetical protein